MNLLFEKKNRVSGFGHKVWGRPAGVILPEKVASAYWIDFTEQAFDSMRGLSESVDLFTEASCETVPSFEGDAISTNWTGETGLLASQAAVTNDSDYALSFVNNTTAFKQVGLDLGAFLTDGDYAWVEFDVRHNGLGSDTYCQIAFNTSASGWTSTGRTINILKTQTDWVRVALLFPYDEAVDWLRYMKVGYMSGAAYDGGGIFIDNMQVKSIDSAATSQLFANNDFVNWSGSFPNEVPDNWVLNGTADANNYLTEDAPSILRLVSNGGLIGTYQDIGDPSNHSVLILLNITDATDPPAVLNIGAGGSEFIESLGTTGIVSNTGSPQGATLKDRLRINRTSGETTDMKFDWGRAYRLYTGIDDYSRFVNIYDRISGNSFIYQNSSSKRPTFFPGLGGYFDGVDDIVDRGLGNEINCKGIIVAFRPDSFTLSSRLFAGKDGSTDVFGVGIYLSASKIQWYIDSAYRQSVNTFAANTWCVGLFYVDSKNNHILRVNGIEEINYNATPAATSTFRMIGNRVSTATYFKGFVGDFYLIPPNTPDGLIESVYKYFLVRSKNRGLIT